MSSESLIRISREELYARVWSEPMRTVARSIGISDVALAKRCHRMDVPHPPRGYWAKKAAGHSVRQKSLPQAKPGKTIESFEVRMRSESSPSTETDSTREGPVWEQEQFEALPENRIIVRDVLDKQRREIRHTRAALRRARSNERGLLVSRESDCFNIQVTKASVERALLIAHAVLDAADARSIPFQLSTVERQTTLFHMLGQVIPVRIDERVQQQDRHPEKKKTGEYVSLWDRRYDYLPTGRLTLRIDEPYLPAPRKSWTDGKTQRVEDCLNNFFVGLAGTAEVMRRIHEDAIRRDAELKERERLRREQEQIRANEERRIKQLRTDAIDWRDSKTILAFVDAVAKEAKRRDGDEVSRELNEWIQWARGYALGLDPVGAEEIRVHVPEDPPEVHYWAT